MDQSQGNPTAYRRGSKAFQDPWSLRRYLMAWLAFAFIAAWLIARVLVPSLSPSVPALEVGDPAGES